LLLVHYVLLLSTEPGYIATSALLVQSALCIVDNRDQMPKRYNILQIISAWANIYYGKHILVYTVFACSLYIHWNYSNIAVATVMVCNQNIVVVVAF